MCCCIPNKRHAKTCSKVRLWSQEAELVELSQSPNLLCRPLSFISTTTYCVLHKIQSPPQAGSKQFLLTTVNKGLLARPCYLRHLRVRQSAVNPLGEGNTLQVCLFKGSYTDINSKLIAFRYSVWSNIRYKLWELGHQSRAQKHTRFFLPLCTHVQGFFIAAVSSLTSPYPYLKDITYSRLRHEITSILVGWFANSTGFLKQNCSLFPNWGPDPTMSSTQTYGSIHPALTAASDPVFYFQSNLQVHFVLETYWCWKVLEFSSSQIALGRLLCGAELSLCRSALPWVRAEPFTIELHSLKCLSAETWFAFPLMSACEHCVRTASGKVVRSSGLILNCLSDFHIMVWTDPGSESILP